MMRCRRLLPMMLLAASLCGMAQGKPRVPVLVELFTSEGCSSCPPADALLAWLGQQQPVEGAQIIVLGEHVDYWDGLGWRDRFSSPQYTARQGEYGRRFSLDSVYTPQMVVDGATQFVGNDQQRARQVVQEAAKRMKVPLVLSRPQVEGLRISASVSALPPASGKMPQGDVYVALVDPMDSTDVRKGENGGRRLNHVSVVRTLVRVGKLRDLVREPLVFHVEAPAGAEIAAMQVVVFAQQEGAGAIVGAVMNGSSMSTGREGLRASGESSGR